MQNNITEQKANSYRGIYEQYVVDASFLWVLRSVNVKQPHYYLSDLAELELRISDNLDGLMSSFELAWKICLEELVYEQAGETFTAAVIAFRSHDINKIKFIVAHGFTNEETFKGLVSALGWLPKTIVNDWIKKFLYSKDLNHKYLAIAVSSLRRKNPGNILNDILSREDCLENEALLARSLRLVGELKLYSLSNVVAKIVLTKNQTIKFWANWALVLLGEYKRILNLFEFIEEDSELQLLATEIIFKVLPIDQARIKISALSKHPDRMRTIIHASGYLGDPYAIPWLIDKMHHIDTAKIAGEAFTLITGIDLERYNLAIDTTEEIAAVPNDDDENVDMDEDENLPFPDVNKINHIWLRYRDRYHVGGRYMMGIEVSQNTPQTIDKLSALLKQVSMRQRKSVALTLALIGPQLPFINSDAKI